MDSHHELATSSVVKDVPAKLLTTVNNKSADQQTALDAVGPETNATVKAQEGQILSEQHINADKVSKVIGLDITSRLSPEVSKQDEAKKVSEHDTRQNPETPDLARNNKGSNKAIVCDICDVSFTVKSSLYRHKMHIHGIPTTPPKNKKEYIPPITDDPAQTKKEVVVLKKKFSCNLCGERFVSKTNVRKHTLRKHSSSVHKADDNLDATSDDHNKDFGDCPDDNFVEMEEEEVKVLLKRYFCEECKTGFTKKGSMIRHMERKHTPRPKPRSTVSKRKLSNVRNEPVEIEAPDGTHRTLDVELSSEQLLSTLSPIKQLRVSLSDSWMPDSKAPHLPETPHFTPTMNDMDEDTLDHDEDFVEKVIAAGNSDSPTTDMQCLVRIIKDLCGQMELLGKQILVLTVDNDSSRWFGSSYGKKYVEQNYNFVSKFFNYCKEECQALSIDAQVKAVGNSEYNEVSKKKRGTKKSLFTNDKGERNRKENDKEINMNKSGICDSNDKTLDSLDDIVDTDFEDIDLDGEDVPQHIEDGENEADNDDYDEDGDYDYGDDNDDGVDDDETTYVKKYSPKPYVRIKKRTVKQFRETAEELEQAEELKNVEHILTKKATKVRSLCYTVPDLDAGKYKCGKCGYNFVWKCHLESHSIKNPNCKPVTEYKALISDVLGETVKFKHYKTGVEVVTTIQKLLDDEFDKTPKTCQICGKTNIRDPSTLMTHMSVHNQSKTFECNICCEGFVNVKYLSMHLKDHFRKPYQCNTCPWKFDSITKLQQHHEKGCDTVEEVTNEEKSKQNDEKPLYETTLFPCKLCVESLKGDPGLGSKSTEEVSKEFAPNGASVQSAGKEAAVMFEGISSLRVHLLAMHGLKYYPYDCCICEKKNKAFKRYEDHLMSAHCGVIYTCPYCSRTFTEKDNVYHQHLRSHQELLAPYMCDICGEKFRKKTNVNSHRRLHTGERPFVCAEEGCGKAFRSNGALLQHKWVHNPTHFICDFCGRKFKKPTLLNNHRQVHLVDFLYPCIYCPEKFSRLWRYKKHLAQKHPFCVEEVFEKYKIVLHKCNMCDKVFYEKEEHTTHMNRHLGVKPYSCNVCGKKFTDKSNLKQHEVTHTGGKKLKCTHCSRRFQGEKAMEAHIAKNHMGKLEAEELSSTLPVEVMDMDEYRESTLQIIDEAIRRSEKF